jgi:hypothetical protein
MAEELVVDRNWAEIPYFRKPWFMALLFLVFMPAYLLMIWTGDTYYWKQGVVYRTSRRRKITTTLVAVGLMLSFFMRQSN